MNLRSLFPLCLLSLWLLPLTAQLRSPDYHRARAGTPSTPIAGQLQERMLTDTLSPPAFDNECALNQTVYNFNDIWGTLSGMNELGDKEKAQLISNTTNTVISITEVLVYFDYVRVVDNGNLRVKVYALDANERKPGAVLGQSDDINADQILADPEEVLTTVFPFSSPLILSEASFILSVDFADLYASRDSTGILHTELGCGDGEDAFEKLPDDTWATMQESWSTDSREFDMNFSIFAVVDFDNPNAVHDPYYQSGHLRLRPASPNPARDMVRINYELEQSGPVRLEIYSAAGRRLQSRQLGVLPRGRHTESVELSDFPSGYYVYSIVTDEARVSSRFIVE